jgi:hypothetical protein
MASLANLEMNRTWSTSTAGRLAQQEFYNQRMHREPIHVAPPNVDGPDSMLSMHRTSFRESNEIPVPSHVGARYTVGTKNALGTHVNYKQVSIDELKVGRVDLGGTDRSWTTNFNDAFRRPNHEHPTQGTKAHRSGKAPRMPFSEVERRFGSLDSTGTMPGKDGVTEGTSENRAAYADPGVQPKINPHLTLGYSNDIGSCVNYQQTPTILADMTHYSLGSIKPNYVTTAMDSTKPPPRMPAGQRSGARPAAGQVPPVGPSEVEQGFRQQFNSQHFNIINGGTRLHADMNADSFLAKANAAAHDHPVGRKQHPNVNPADRGVSGMRQAYDIISGIDRPRERW